jgi:hypothetical protein
MDKRWRSDLLPRLFITLQQFGYGIVAQGLTSIDEIDRVSGSE